VSPYRIDSRFDRERRLAVLRRSKIVLVVGILAALALSACGGTGGAGGGGTVDVTLQEWAVIPAQSSVEAGSVTFNVKNDGPDHPHELVVIRTDLAADALPTMPEGMVDEEGEGIEVNGEIEEFPSGETRSATFDLDSGSYVLVCNVVGEEGGEHGGGGEVHYEMGMRAAFTVQ
jgi:plastocyanin